MPKILFSLALFVLVGGFVFFLPFFRIKTITVLPNQDCLSLEQISQEKGIYGQNIFFISKNKISKKLKDKFACLKDTKIKTKLPSILEIEIETAKVLVQIESTNLYLNEEGLVLENPNLRDKPTFYPGQKLDFLPGQKINDDTVMIVLKIVNLLAKTDFSTSSVRIVEPTIIVAYNRQDLAAIFSTRRDSNNQVNSLQLVLAAAKIDGTKIAKIDLRFDKPVIVYK